MKTGPVEMTDEQRAFRRELIERERLEAGAEKLRLREADAFDGGEAQRRLATEGASDGRLEHPPETMSGD
jgi:hypothetical protein